MLVKSQLQVLFSVRPSGLMWALLVLSSRLFNFNLCISLENIEMAAGGRWRRRAQAQSKANLQWLRIFNRPPETRVPNRATPPRVLQTASPTGDSVKTQMAKPMGTCLFKPLCYTRLPGLTALRVDQADLRLVVILPDHR